MTPTQVTLTIAAASLILIPSFVAEFRWRTRLMDRLQKAESFHDFLKTYLLKNAVLEFHSPDPNHRAADRAIERLVEGKELSAEEIRTLVRRIEGEAAGAEDTKRRLQAQTVLVIMDEFMEAVTGHKFTSFSEFE